ncbi:MAG: hypothetical protein WAO61_02845 [Solirubrobacterales bacterium]
MPDAILREARLTPHNQKTGFSSPYELHYAGKQCEAVIGSNRHVWPVISNGDFTVPLIVDDTPLVFFAAEEDHLLLTVQLFDEMNELLLQIDANEMVYSSTSWDIELIGKTLTMRGGKRDIFVRITFDPPSRVIVDKGHLWRNGIELVIEPDHLLLANNNHRISGCEATNCQLGISVGDPLPGIGGAMHFGSDRNPTTSRDADTEGLVKKLVCREQRSSDSATKI